MKQATEDIGMRIESPLFDHTIQETNEFKRYLSYFVVVQNCAERLKTCLRGLGGVVN